MKISIEEMATRNAGYDVARWKPTDRALGIGAGNRPYLTATWIREEEDVATATQAFKKSIFPAQGNEANFQKAWGNPECNSCIVARQFTVNAPDHYRVINHPVGSQIKGDLRRDADGNIEVFNYLTLFLRCKPNGEALENIEQRVNNFFQASENGLVTGITEDMIEQYLAATGFQRNNRVQPQQVANPAPAAGVVPNPYAPQ